MQAGDAWHFFPKTFLTQTFSCGEIRIRDLPLSKRAPRPLSHARRGGLKYRPKRRLWPTTRSSTLDLSRLDP